MEQNAVVFVGFNPSFSDRGWRRLSQFWSGPEFDPHEFFAWSNRESLDVELAGELEQIARRHYAYFKPAREFAATLDLPWEHLDVFAIRHKSQRHARKLVFSDLSQLRLNRFGELQFRLFEHLLASAEPRAVLVANALASQLYVKRRTPAFDGRSGHHWDRLGDNRVPVLFSGMLTGQRALDRFSRDRLYWQLARAIGQEWLPLAR